MDISAGCCCHSVASCQSSLRTLWHRTKSAAPTFILSTISGNSMGGIHPQQQHWSFSVTSCRNTTARIADLTELSRTRMCVVCAGVKSVLDIPRTLEVLETLGVAVASFKSPTFPAFFSQSSGCVAPSRVDTAAQAAKLVRAMQHLQLHSSLLIGNICLRPMHLLVASYMFCSFTAVSSRPLGDAVSSIVRHCESI